MMTEGTFSAESTPSKPAPEQSWIKVWDPLVRFGHWLLLIAIATALITRGEPESLHQGAGYVVAGYVVFRLFWGIAGPEHARFENFIASPKAALGYLGGLLNGKAKRHLGHSPPGGLMVIALLFAMSATAATGMAMENKVPVPTIVQTLVPIELEAEEEDSPWEEIHEAAANLVLGLVFLHIGGVIAASIGHKENLVRAMVNGKKRAP